MSAFKSLVVITGVLMLPVCFAGRAAAVAPTPEAVEKWKADGVWDQVVADWKAFKKAGGCSPSKHPVYDRNKQAMNMALGGNSTTTLNALVILVYFDDNAMTATAAQFDSILFSDRRTDPIINPTGSMTDYYLENSYGKLVVTGEIYGPYHIYEPYTYWAGTDHGLSLSPALVSKALDSAHAHIGDMSRFDQDHDGYCDGLIVIHAGPGAEQGGDGIWSHESSISQRTYNNVKFSDYTMNPEKYGASLSPIGVFCHEYGHFLGLPDLYDIDYTPASSDGLGQWSLMASGNYNGASRRPSHLDAWCKYEVGFLFPTWVGTTNMADAPIPQVETDPVVYALQTTPLSSEYWLVENRQLTGSDVALPGAGLCIYHVDEAAPANNTDYLRYYVAMEQADGKNDLALTVGNQGDGGDTWPGATNNRNFHDQSIPSSRRNVGGTVTQVGVWRISDSDSLMTADLDIRYSRPYAVLTTADSVRFLDSEPGEGDGDGVIEAGETISFYCTVKNLMLTGYNVRASLAAKNPSVTLLNNNVPIASTFNGTPVNNLTPIKFKVADTLKPIIDSFFLTITADSLNGVAGSANWSKTFGVEVNLGPPQIVVVDDDQGDNYDSVYAAMVYHRRIPYKVWHANVSGSPTGAQLGQYPMVFWHTGSKSGGSLNAADVTALREYLRDYNGKLFLSGFAPVGDIKKIDASFVSDYLRVDSTGSARYFSFLGAAGNPVTGGMMYRWPAVVQYAGTMAALTPKSGAEAAMMDGLQNKIVGVTYSGTYRLVLLTFPFEYISDDFVLDGFATKDTLLNRVIAFFGETETGIYDGKPFAGLPTSFDLDQNYPNPFNPSTIISYTLRAQSSYSAKPTRTRLVIFNTLGQEVTTLVDQVQFPGTYTVEWNGNNAAGHKVSSGVYFYRLSRGDDFESKKMVLLK